MSDEIAVCGVKMPFGQPVKRVQTNGRGVLMPLRLKLDWQRRPVAAAGYDDVAEMVGVIRRLTGSCCRRNEVLATHADEGEEVALRAEGFIMAVDGDGLTVALNLHQGIAI